MKINAVNEVIKSINGLNLKKKDNNWEILEIYCKGGIFVKKVF